VARASRPRSRGRLAPAGTRGRACPERSEGMPAPRSPCVYPTGCRGGSRTAPTSRQFVLIDPPLSLQRLRLVLIKSGVLCSFSGQIALKMRLKRAIYAAFKIPTSFVFKYFLASFPLFSVFWSFLCFPIAPAIPSSAAVRWFRSLPTTMCPSADHSYRLSHRQKVVKRKIRAGGADGQVGRWQTRQVGRWAGGQSADGQVGR